MMAPDSRNPGPPRARTWTPAGSWKRSRFPLPFPAASTTTMPIFVALTMAWKTCRSVSAGTAVSGRPEIAQRREVRIARADHGGKIRFRGHVGELHHVRGLIEDVGHLLRIGEVGHDHAQ